MYYILEQEHFEYPNRILSSESILVCLSSFFDKIKKPFAKDSDNGTSSNPSSGNNQPNKKENSAKSNEKKVIRILLADDILENRMLLDIVLKKHGYEVVMCNNGKEAVDLAEKEHFDLILMDIYMPGMNGIEATKIIKQQKNNITTPIIAVTAADSEEEKIQRIGAGCDDYVAKPVDFENLIKRINKYLPQIEQRRIAESGGDIHSLLAKDPTYKKTIDRFVKSLPDNLKEIENTAKNLDMDTLAIKVHSLKGVGGMAGFPVYSQRAAELEVCVKSEQPDMQEIIRQIDELIDMVKKTKK